VTREFSAPKWFAGKPRLVPAAADDGERSPWMPCFATTPAPSVGTACSDAWHRLTCERLVHVGVSIALNVQTRGVYGKQLLVVG
jgi:hypothetical protein